MSGNWTYSSKLCFLKKLPQFSPNSPSSSSQDSVFDVNRYTQNPVPERSGSTSGQLRGDPLHETTEPENKNKHEEREVVQRMKFGAMVEYHPISAKDQSRLHQFGARVLPGIFLGYALYAG